MQQLDLQTAADYLDVATIEHTYDSGFAIVHTGRSASGVRFVIVNDCYGKTTLSESI